MQDSSINGIIVGNMNKKTFKQICERLTIIVLFVGILLTSLDTSAQSNRNKRKNNFSRSGKNYSVVRHGISLNLGTSLDITPMFGFGYSCSQYYGTGNRYMQQSLTYQVGLGNKLIHNVVGTFHCTYIGTFDMSPCIYGIALHFAMSPDKYSETNMGNLYLRPEFGLVFPMKYKKRTQERLPITASLTYGYNVRMFMSRAEMDVYRDKYDIRGDADMPWTSRNHHMITFRINFNFANLREL